MSNVKNRQTVIVGLNLTNSQSLRTSIRLPFSPHSVIVRQCSWVSGEVNNQGHAVIYSDLIDYSPQLCIIRDGITDSPSIEHVVNNRKIAHGNVEFVTYLMVGDNSFIPSGPATVAFKGTALLTLEFVEFSDK